MRKELWPAIPALVAAEFCLIGGLSGYLAFSWATVAFLFPRILLGKCPLKKKMVVSVIVLGYLGIWLGMTDLHLLAARLSVQGVFFGIVNGILIGGAATLLALVGELNPHIRLSYEQQANRQADLETLVLFLWIGRGISLFSIPFAFVFSAPGRWFYDQFDILAARLAGGSDLLEIGIHFVPLALVTMVYIYMKTHPPKQA